MKSYNLISFLILVFLWTNIKAETKRFQNEYANSPSIFNRKKLHDKDTLRVSQDDQSVFRYEKALITRPCSKPQFQDRYELIHPQIDTYYFIYNPKKELIFEGKYTAKGHDEKPLYKKVNFYNSKRYYYKKNGQLEMIHYQEDGRNSKTEYFDGKKRLVKIRYIDKKSEETSKIEIYKNNRLAETRTYTSFSQYTTVKTDK